MDELKKETAPEVPVQEQLIVNISFDESILNKKMKKINSLINQIEEEIKTIHSSVLVTYQNS